MIFKMKRGMRSLLHHLQVTFSQSVSRLVAYFFFLQNSDINAQ